MGFKDVTPKNGTSHGREHGSSRKSKLGSCRGFNRVGTENLA